MVYFTTKTEAYTQLLSLLHQMPQKFLVAEAIAKIKLLFENHEQNIEKILSILNPLLADKNLSYSDQQSLKLFKQQIQSTDFNQATLEQRFQNPHRRYFDSLIAIKMLTEPTPNMMAIVGEMSSHIIKALEETSNLEAPKLNGFLQSLKQGGGDCRYQAAISLGAFQKKPQMNEVFTILSQNNPHHLPAIMHIHFKFALHLSRELPFSPPIREPIGAFKDIATAYAGNYNNYFSLLAAKGTIGLQARKYLPDEIIYHSKLFEERGRLGKLNYQIQTQTLGLMLTQQAEYEQHFPVMPLTWTADAKAQIPDLSSRVVLDLIENDAIYVAGPSGMVSLLLGMMENRGNFSSIAEKLSYFAAIYAYVVGGGFHSPHEVLAPAAYCLDLIPNYPIKLPKQLGSTIPPQVGHFLDALCLTDKAFAQIRQNVWQTYLHFFQKPIPKIKQNKISDTVLENIYQTIKSIVDHNRIDKRRKLLFFKSSHLSSDALTLLDQIKTTISIKNIDSGIKERAVLDTIKHYLQYHKNDPLYLSFILTLKEHSFYSPFDWSSLILKDISFTDTLNKLIK